LYPIFISPRADAEAQAVRARYSTEAGNILFLYLFIFSKINLDTYLELKNKMRLNIESLLNYMVKLINFSFLLNKLSLGYSSHWFIKK